MGRLHRIVTGKQSLLRATLVDHLAEVALQVRQSYADDRHARVARGFELIPGYIAKASRADGKRLAQHELHCHRQSLGSFSGPFRETRSSEC